MAWMFWADTISSLRSWVLILGMSGLIVLFWFVGEGVALRYFVSISSNSSLHVLTLFFFLQILFIGVMSCLYCLWDVIG